MIIKLIPKTILGKWSIVLIVIMPVFFYIGMSFVSFYESVPAGKTIPHDIVVRPGVALSMLAGFISGIAAFFTGIVGIIKKNDNSILIFLSTVAGFLVLLWCLAQILFPLYYSTPEIVPFETKQECESVCNVSELA